MEDEMYAEILIQNYEHPSNKGTIAGATAQMDEENISCGDRITVYLTIDEGRIKDAKFDGAGCVISMGTASMLIDELKGKSLEDVEKMDKQYLLRLINIDPGPVRMHCATLSLRALKKAVLAYEKKPLDTATKEL